MAEPRELAHKARTTLTEALQALQSSSDVPAHLLEIAEPIAQTMGILHHVEKTGEATAEGCTAALDNVRGALDALQSIEQEHPAIDMAMEAVAGSLSKLFALARAVPQPPTNPAPIPADQPPAPPAAPVPPPPPAIDWGAGIPAAGAGVPAAGAGVPAAGGGVPAAGVPAAGGGGTVDIAKQQAAPQPAAGGGTVDMAKQQAAPQPAAQPAPTAQLPGHTPAMSFDKTVPVQDIPDPKIGSMPTGQAERVPGQTDAPTPETDASIMDVELGAHSGSNFFKGLSGNDVIDHGGVFVATYAVPKLGSAVALRLLFPGDLEFVADGIVQWTRETRSGESEPGFGAKFTRISQEGRQLVYRYVRNREPMFYDDM